MEVTQEKIERVAQYARVDAGLAKQALEESEGHQLEAVLLLERKGWTRKPKGGVWATDWETNAEAREQEYEDGPASNGSKEGRQSAREVVDIIAELMRDCVHITIDIWRRDDLLAGIPLIICILLFLAAPYVMIPLALVGVLFLNCRYHVSGWAVGEKTVNRAMDEVTDTVQDVMNPLRKRVKQRLRILKGDINLYKRRKAREAEQNKK